MYTLFILYTYYIYIYKKVLIFGLNSLCISYIYIGLNFYNISIQCLFHLIQIPSTPLATRISRNAYIVVVKCGDKNTELRDYQLSSYNISHVYI